MKKRSTIENYNKISKDEKQLRVIRSDFDLLKHHTSVKIKFGNIDKNSLILDIGCGEGFDLKSLEEHGFCPIGLDISIGMLKKCQKNVGDSINLICADVEHIPFKNNSFDLIYSREISFFNTSHSSFIIKHLSEVKNILKKGGIIMSMLPTKDYEGSNFKPYSKEEIKYLYRKSGFRDTEFVYPMKSISLKFSRRIYSWFTGLLKNESSFIIGLGVK